MLFYQLWKSHPSLFYVRVHMKLLRLGKNNKHILSLLVLCEYFQFSFMLRLQEKVIWLVNLTWWCLRIAPNFLGGICVQTLLELKVLHEHKYSDENSAQSFYCSVSPGSTASCPDLSHIIRIPAHLISKGMYPSQGGIPKGPFLEVFHRLKIAGFLSWLRSLSRYHFYYQDVSATNICFLELLCPGILNPELSSYLEQQRWRNI